MNKKFLSAILCGAMLVTALGTFVSCKDYDDDIEDLQSQIDGLSTSSSSLSSSLSSVQSTLESELSSAQSSLQSQITSAQSALQSAIDNKADASEISTLATNLATLQQNYEAKTATLDAQIAAAQTAIEALQAAGSNEEALQSAIDAANATLSALTGTVSDETEAREAAVANLQIQLDALNAFQEAVEAADYQAQIDALKEYIEGSDDSTSLTEQIEAVKAELEEAIAANTTDIATLKETMQSISDALVDINPNLNAITVLVEAGVTGIELVYSYTAQQDEEGNMALGTDLVFTNGIEQDNVFGTDADGNAFDSAIEFKAGRLYKKDASFIVRVSPINATLTTDMIQFVNSEGGTLDDIVTVTKVEKLSKTLLTKAATAETGLWKITVEVVDDLAKDDFNAATQTTVSKETKDILFAVQANNTLEAYAGRYATSTYDLTMEWGEYTPVSELYYNVDKTAVTAIANRYAGEVGNAFLDDPATEIERAELCWYTSDADKYPIPAVSGNKNNTATDESDDRAQSGTEYNLYPATVGQTITVTLQEMVGEKLVDTENIRAMYVTLDYQDFAVESLPSEWVAWNSYDISGLNEVVEGTSIDITVNDKSADGDIIGFRVFAVNYDGTLVDPDGKAFYIGLGEAGKSWNVIATTIVPEGEKIYTTTSDTIATTLSALKDAATSSWKTTAEIKNGSNPSFNIVMLNKSNGIVAYTKEGELVNVETADFSTVTKIYTTILSDPNDDTSDALNAWSAYTDNTAYTGTLVITNSTGRTLATLTVTMTKVLPTGLPSDFSIKTNQVENGIYYAFLVPSNEDGEPTWSAGEADYGLMGMDQIFNFGTTDADILCNYITSWGTSDKDNKGNLISVDVAASDTLVVDKSYVDNSTKHTTTVYYDYGVISSDTKTYPTYTVEAATFQSIYVSIYTENAYTWSWATLDELKEIDSDIDSKATELPYSTTLTYGEDNDDNNLNIKYIFGTSLKDSRYNAIGLVAVDKVYTGPYESSIALDEDADPQATLTTDANGLDEYFDVEIDGETGDITFTPKSQDTNPMGDIPSTLTIYCIDSYGNPVVIELPMTVTKR